MLRSDEVMLHESLLEALKKSVEPLSTLSDLLGRQLRSVPFFLVSSHLHGSPSSFFFHTVSLSLSLSLPLPPLSSLSLSSSTAQIQVRLSEAVEQLDSFLDRVGQKVMVLFQVAGPAVLLQGEFDALSSEAKMELAGRFLELGREGAVFFCLLFFFA